MRKPQECPACFENGRPISEHRASPCAAYNAQRVWNRKMRALLSHEPDLQTVPEPPDYSDHWATGPLGVAGHYAGTGWVSWTRGVYALLAQNGATYRRLRAALDRATITTTEPATISARRSPRKAA
jgi:hypothetical protein